jgi:hypothetical protein
VTLSDSVEATGLPRVTLVATPAPRSVWEEAFKADPLALETQSPAWTDAMCQGRI